MLAVPPSLAGHFQDSAGRVNYGTLLRTLDRRLLAPPRRMPWEDRLELYHRLRTPRLNWFEGMSARAAGVDVDALRRRFLWILEAASAADPAAAPA